MIVAALAATGIGQAADAATYTTLEYDMFVRYEGTSFSDVSFHPISHSHYGFDGKNIDAGDTSLGLKSYLFGLPAIGTIFQFALKVVHPRVPVHEPYYGNGGRTPVCQLGPWDCTSTNTTGIYGTQLMTAKDDEWWMYLLPSAGSSFDVGFWSTHARPGAPFVSADGNHWYWYRDEASRFTILAVNSPAPVPLPATAALLPLGISALAVMRKRRKSRQVGAV